LLFFILLFFFMLPLQPRSTLFPYTTLFRSSSHAEGVRVIGLPRTPPRQGSHAPNAPRRGLGRRLGRADGVPTRLRRTTAKEDRRSEEHTSELQSQSNLVCRLLLEKKKKQNN